MSYTIRWHATETIPLHFFYPPPLTSCPDFRRKRMPPPPFWELVFVLLNPFQISLVQCHSRGAFFGLEIGILWLLVAISGY